MFSFIINEAKINLTFELESPLCIKTGDENMLNPVLPDMQCVKTIKNNKVSYIIPGSSFKGVVRSRFEKVSQLLGENSCDILNWRKSCNIKEDKDNERDVYASMCYTCQLFGSTKLASRIYFKDLKEADGSSIETSIRNGVGIDRITGAAKEKSLYEYEVIDDAKFSGKIIIKNFEPKHLKILMYVFRDIDEGYVSFGSSSSRGNGLVSIKDFQIEMIQYSNENNQFNLSNYFNMKEKYMYEDNENCKYNYLCLTKNSHSFKEFVQNNFTKEGVVSG
jgi:CRISPR-associated RAMP protein (TIGR02581 family)